MVDADARASARLTDEGSLWKFDAVRMAACFCSKVVPSAGGFALLPPPKEEPSDDLPSLEKRFWSSFTWEFDPAGGGDAAAVVVLGSGLADLPMPKAGTETPAELRRETADEFK